MGGRADRLSQRTRSQRARIPPRPPHGGGLRRRRVPVRLRRPARVRVAVGRPHGAVDDRRGPRVRERSQSRRRPVHASASRRRCGRLPAWKRDADRLFTQVSFSVDRLTEWRSTIDFDGPIYAGGHGGRQRGDGPEAHPRLRPARRAGRRHRAARARPRRRRAVGVRPRAPDPRIGSVRRRAPRAGRPLPRRRPPPRAAPHLRVVPGTTRAGARDRYRRAP